MQGGNARHYLEEIGNAAKKTASTLHPHKLGDKDISQLLNISNVCVVEYCALHEVPARAPDGS